VDIIREWIEGFLRGRYGYEGYRALWVLAVLVLIGPILVAVVLVALAVVLAGLDQPLHQYPWDVVPRRVAWWRALCTELRSR
jgi:hypothetical protein